ncbi:hypothetical protein PM082_021613 [Marasmius tenuissimus]|nr:hypothetical protein PM082_021613 [Marasmius tenuissimus]
MRLRDLFGSKGDHTSIINSGVLLPPPTSHAPISTSASVLHPLLGEHTAVSAEVAMSSSSESNLRPDSSSTSSAATSDSLSAPDSLSAFDSLATASRASIMSPATQSPTPSPSETSEIPTTAAQVAGHESSASATIGGAVGGAVGAILIVVVIIIIWVRRSRGGYRQAGWIMLTAVNRCRRQRPNLQVTALPITTVGPERVVEKTQELSRQRLGSRGLTATNDRGIARSRGVDSSGEDQRARARGTDSEVLVKLDMIMERVTRLEEADRDRDMEEAPPDYTSNRS